VVQFIGDHTQDEVSLVHVFLQSLLSVGTWRFHNHHVKWQRPQNCEP